MAQVNAINEIVYEVRVYDEAANRAGKVFVLNSCSSIRRTHEATFQHKFSVGKFFPK